MTDTGDLERGPHLPMQRGPWNPGHRCTSCPTVLYTSRSTCKNCERERTPEPNLSPDQRDDGRFTHTTTAEVA